MQSALVNSMLLFKTQTCLMPQLLLVTAPQVPLIRLIWALLIVVPIVNRPLPVTCLAIICHGHGVGGKHLPHLLPSVLVDNNGPHTRLNDVTRDFQALTMDNTTLLGTDDSETSRLPVIDEDLSMRYSRLRAEARMLFQAHIVLDIHALTQYTLSMHYVVAAWFDNLCYSWTNSNGAEFLSSSIDDQMPGLEPVTSLHSQFITNDQFFAFLDESPIPITVDADILRVHFFTSEPCTSWSSTHSQSGPFVVQDIVDAYHHVHIYVDHTDISSQPISVAYSAYSNPPYTWVITPTRYITRSDDHDYIHTGRNRCVSNKATSHGGWSSRPMV